MSNDLQDFKKCLDASSEEYRNREEEWRKAIGKPKAVYTTDEDSLGVWMISAEDGGGAFTARIGRRGPIMSTAQSYSPRFIRILYSVANNLDLDGLDL